MRAAIRFACYGLLAAGLTSALPFEAIDDQHNRVRDPAKSRSYAVVNVDGSSNANDAGHIDTSNEAQALEKRAPIKSYSVVNVDGGPTSSQQLSSVTLTETVPPTPTTEIVVSTKPAETVVYTQDTTIVITETHYPAPSVTQTVVYTTTIVASPSGPTTTETSSTTDSVTSTTTIAPTSTVIAGNTTFIMPSLTSSPVVSVSLVTLPPVTVTASQTDTTSYYDNGMWHTSYAIKTWPTVTAA